MFNHKKNLIIFFFLLLLAYFLRVYRLDSPLADWHSWRQADTSAVTRNMIKFKFDLLHPRFDDLSNIPSGKDNPNGYRFVEFPIYNTVVAFIYKLFPLLSIEAMGRLISILASLGSLIFLSLFVNKYLGNKTALWSGFFFAVLPYNIFYSRVILPEPHLVFAVLGSIYFLDKWLEKEKIYLLILAILFSSFALLIKVSAIFIWPVYFYLIFSKYKLRSIVNPFVMIFAILSLLPLLFWRYWMGNFPEGIPAFDWLLNGGGIRFRPAFFRWLLYERLTKLILGYALLPVFLFGFFHRFKRNPPVFLAWFLGLILYVSIIARGNIQHDYYQVLLIPLICVYLGKGIVGLLEIKYLSLLKIGAVVILLITGIYSSWGIIKTYYWINNSKIIIAGRAVSKIVPKNAKIIAPYGGDTTFLYQTERQGWPQGFEIEDKIKKGASYYVNINIDDPETKYVMNKWNVVAKTKDYVIVKLK